MTELYIPPPGITFRLLGHSSQKVLFSRNVGRDLSQNFGTESVGTTRSDDQYFTLVLGTGSNQGKYLFKSKLTGKILFTSGDTY